METSIIETGLAHQFSGTPIQQTVASFCDPANRESLELLHRYQTRLQNMYNRALRSLVLLRQRPLRNPPPPGPDPGPIAVVRNEPKTPFVSREKASEPAPPALPEPLAALNSSEPPFDLPDPALVFPEMGLK
jgi:hypothetical protein